MVRLLTCKSYRSLLLILCYVKHSVASKQFFQLHPRHQLYIGDDYNKLNCSKLISMHYYLGSILSYKTLQHFGIVYFKVMYVFCPRKILVDIHPKILGASCVFYFRVINFYFKITRLTWVAIDKHICGFWVIYRQLIISHPFINFLQFTIHSIL